MRESSREQLRLRPVSSTPELSFADLNIVSQGEDRTRALADIIERNENLKTIIADTSLANDELTERLCEAAFRNPSIKELRYSIRESWNPDQEIHSSRIPHWVSNAPNLDTLTFWYISPHSVDLHAIVHSFRLLRALELYQVRYPDRMIQELATFLRSSSTLKELTLRYSGIRQAETIRSLGEALGNNVMEKLRILGSNCGPGLVGRLGVVLSVNTSLTALELYNCNLGDDDVVALCQGLTHNNTLQSLELSSNCFGYKGVTAVATLIASNDQLINISICHHRGESNSIVQIGHALKHNTNLKSLNVFREFRNRRFGLGPIYASALLDGIKEHPTLIEVYAPKGFNDAQKHELWYHLKLNCGAPRLLNSPLNHWPLLLHGADRCRPLLGSVGWGDSPSMLYYFVKEKCDLFKVSTRHVDGLPGVKE